MRTKHLWVQRREGRRMGRKYPSLSDSWVWKSVMNSPSGVRGGTPAENGFIAI